MVVGNEPAGLWLLSRFAKALGPEAARRELAWIRFPRASVVCTPTFLPEYSSSSVAGRPWHVELVAPEGNLVWEPDSIAKRFPELPSTFCRSIIDSFSGSPQISHLETIRKAIRLHPELLGLSSAVWKFIGRTKSLQPEMLVWGALLCTELAWWDPSTTVSGQVTEFCASEWENTLEEVKSLKRGSLFVKFRDQPAIVGRKWILNLPYRSFIRLSGSHPGLIKLLSFEEDLRAKLTLYRFCLEAEATVIPNTLMPVTVLLDTDVVPEWDTEIWPFTVEDRGATKRVELFASAPTITSVNAIVNRFVGGLKRLCQLFPFLSGSINHLYPPLCLESCFTQKDRIIAGRNLEQNSVELYDHTSFLTQTRHPGMLTLFPFLHCHLPYPVGPVLAARRMPEDIFGKKAWKTLTMPRANSTPPP